MAKKRKKLKVITASSRGKGKTFKKTVNKSANKKVEKLTTLEQLKDETLGKIGTKKRDNFEKKLKKELSKSSNKNWDTPNVQKVKKGDVAKSYPKATLTRNNKPLQIGNRLNRASKLAKKMIKIDLDNLDMPPNAPIRGQQNIKNGFKKIEPIIKDNYVIMEVPYKNVSTANNMVIKFDKSELDKFKKGYQLMIKFIGSVIL